VSFKFKRGSVPGRRQSSISSRAEPLERESAEAVGGRQAHAQSTSHPAHGHVAEVVPLHNLAFPLRQRGDETAELLSPAAVINPLIERSLAFHCPQGRPTCWKPRTIRIGRQTGELARVKHRVQRFSPRPAPHCHQAGAPDRPERVRPEVDPSSGILAPTARHKATAAAWFRSSRSNAGGRLRCTARAIERDQSRLSANRSTVRGAPIQTPCTRRITCRSECRSSHDRHKRACARHTRTQTHRVL
jgi:hypothetical protein